jgi:hypothetical protein
MMELMKDHMEKGAVLESRLVFLRLCRVHTAIGEVSMKLEDLRIEAYENDNNQGVEDCSYVLSKMEPLADAMFELVMKVP